MKRKPAKTLPARPVRDRDAADRAFDTINAFLQCHVSGPKAKEAARLAYQAAQMLRQYARHGIPAPCECKTCRDARSRATS